jgi:mRNA interferase MazF
MRPAVCLTEPIGPHQHIVLAFITSQKQPTILPSDLFIDATASDFGTTGLRVSSTLQLHRLMTVTQTLLARQLGSLSPRMQNDVDIKLRMLFGV